MDIAIVSLLVTNLILLAFLAHKLRRSPTADASPKEDKVSITYFHEIQEVSGLFRSEKIVKVKAQLFIAGFPIGQPFVMREQKFEKVDKELVNKYVGEIVEPLIKLGVTVKAIT